VDELFIKVQGLIKAGDVLISEHGYDELIEDNLSVRELLDGVINGAVVERYTDYPKGPCLLLLQQDKFGNPVHVVWGIPKESGKPVVLVTAYRPDPKRWDENFLRRRKK